MGKAKAYDRAFRHDLQANGKSEKKNLKFRKALIYTKLFSCLNLNPKICIYDLDGTIIDSSHRAKYSEWNFRP